MNKIGRKILITYFAILLCVFLITDVTFIFLSRRYLVNETSTQLQGEGQRVASMLGTLPLKEAELRDKISNVRKTIKIAGRFVDAEIVIFNKEGRILYKDVEDADKSLIELIYNSPSSRVNGYVSRIVPIVGRNSELKGNILLFTRVKNIYALNVLLRRTQFISFGIASIIALIIGLLFAEKLVRPLKQLSLKLERFSANRTLDSKVIRTGDEIEELDRCFVEMAARIKQFDEKQIRFLQNTSHELKTPLMSIQGYAEAIKDGVVEGKEAEESLDIIIEQSQRLKKTVEDIIYLTKLESEDEKFSYEECCIWDIFDSAVRSVKPLAEEKGIRLIYDSQIEYPGYFDGEKLTRAFINILGNGIRYAKGIIEIKAIDCGDHIRLLICDDGAGFEKVEESKLFDRFYKGNKGNIGLGLSITKAIIEGHGGGIKAYNGDTGGAVFEIVLPKSKKNETK
ncbi:MAG TPA: HAMP domain-containing sensor histidine kinase [Clostridia bacterium]|nr:HAMP domain-containing sensor histidine kinase [Clostridia bacterium]